jgi:hypothetical protein
MVQTLLESMGNLLDLLPQKMKAGKELLFSD